MPTSHFHQLNEIVEAMVLVKPESVLDIGVGFAKYGLLAREYLDAAWCRTPESPPKCRIDGIEGFAPYVVALHGLVYDHVYVGDALTVLPTIDRKYDLALMIDVIEHLEHAQGMRLLEEVRHRATNVLVSTPIDFHRQEAVFGNDFEIHRSHWRARDFAALHPRCFVPNDHSLICIVGPAAPRVHARLNSWRRRVSRQAPWLANLYRRGRSMLRHHDPR
jgi:hypothetical protein